MTNNGRQPEYESAAWTRLLPDLAERDLPAGRRTVLKEHLMSEIRPADARPAHDAKPAGGPAATRRRRPRLVLAAAAAAAVGALVAATVVGLQSAPKHPARAGLAGHAGAVQLLAMIANAAARQPAPAVSNNEFEYIRSKVAFTNTSVTTGPGNKQVVHVAMGPLHERQIWLSVSDLCKPGLLREYGRDTVLSESAKGILIQGKPAKARCPDRGSLNAPTYRLLQSLPTDPHALLRLIYKVEKGHGPSPDAEAFTTIGDLLAQSITPPKVSAALYNAAGLIPGVTVISHAKDAIGRSGVAVAFTSEGTRYEWIFNKATLQWLGERDVALSAKAGGGMTAILERGFVSKPGQVPSAG